MSDRNDPVQEPSQERQAQAADQKQKWITPDFSKLKAEETATGSGGFDEDSDTKAGS